MDRPAGGARDRPLRPLEVGWGLRCRRRESSTEKGMHEGLYNPIRKQQVFFADRSRLVILAAPDKLSVCWVQP
jgi:hypothetical protein